MATIHSNDDGDNEVAETGLFSTESEDPCPSCGVLVRSGLLRCWKCGAFMRKDIAERYEKLQSTPQKIVYSDTPTDEHDDYMPARVRTDESDEGDSGTTDADFELGDIIATAPAAPSAEATSPPVTGDDPGTFTLTQPEPAAPAAKAVPPQPVGDARPETPQPTAIRLAVPTMSTIL